MFGFAPSPIELCIVLVVAVLLFGKRLPSIARSVGSSFVEFKNGLKGLDDSTKDLSKEVSDTLKEA